MVSDHLACMNRRGVHCRTRCASASDDLQPVSGQFRARETDTGQRTSVVQRLWQGSSLHTQLTERAPVVFLAITPHGLEEALRQVGSSSTEVWCSADAISNEDFCALKRGGLTRLEYALGTRDAALLERTLDTIDQHHPNELVWIEAATQTN